MGDLTNKVAASYAAFIECGAARNMKALLCLDDGMCTCRRDTEFMFAAFLDAIAEPSEAQQNAAGDYCRDHGLSGARAWSSAEFYRSMIAALRKELEGG